MIRSAFLRLAFSNILIALNAGGYAYVATVLAHMPLEPGAILLPGLSTYVVYSFDKTLRSDPLADAVNDPERTAFLSHWRKPLLALMAAALVAGFVLAIPRGASVIAIYLLPLVAGFLYSVQVLPEGFRYRRLKDVTGGKSLTVALSWALTTVLTPLFYTGSSFSPALLIVLLWVFGREFINTVYFDMADLKGDRAEGLVTIPVYLGHGTTRRLLHAVNIALGLGLGTATLLGYLPPAAQAVNLLTLYSAYYLSRATDENSDVGFLCDVVADGEAVVAALLAWLAIL